MRTPLLDGKVRVVDGGNSRFVGPSVEEDPPELRSGRFDAAGEDQCRIAEVYEGHLAAAFNPPTASQRRRKAHLASMRDLRH